LALNTNQSIPYSKARTPYTYTSYFPTTYVYWICTVHDPSMVLAMWVILRCLIRGNTAYP